MREVFFVSIYFRAMKKYSLQGCMQIHADPAVLRCSSDGPQAARHLRCPGSGRPRHSRLAVGEQISQPGKHPQGVRVPEETERARVDANQIASTGGTCLFFSSLRENESNACASDCANQCFRAHLLLEHLWPVCSRRIQNTGLRFDYSNVDSLMIPVLMSCSLQICSSTSWNESLSSCWLFFR